MLRLKWLVPTIYIVFLMLPIYWLLNMSFKTNVEIVSGFSLWPRDFTLAHYKTIFTDVSWYSGYINSLIYVAINTVISLLVALPAAYDTHPSHGAPPPRQTSHRWRFRCA